MYIIKVISKIWLTNNNLHKVTLNLPHYVHKVTATYYDIFHFYTQKVT